VLKSLTMNGLQYTVLVSAVAYLEGAQGRRAR
jgi:hypothetical protein